VEGALRTRIELVHGAGETMRALVDDILDLARLETGKLAVNRAPLRLRDLLREATALWRAKAEAKGLTLDLDLDGCPALIEEDAERLRQILFNLLSNAVKFTEAGSVRMSVRMSEERLSIVIADTGIGIAPEHHALIFDKFQQADQSTSRRFGGSGLGLAICRNLADAMDGRITLESRLGEGATFTLSLPLRLIETDEEPAALAEPLAPVLLLEPNLLGQRVIAKRLREAVGAVDIVADADALHAAIVQGARSYVVLQASAAGEALQPLVAAAAARGMRPVVLWGEADGVDEAGLVAMGGIPLRKPASPDMIALALAGTPSGAGMAA
jgi:anti-sigma regulatory factor (Ser/Thr protein kinase)